MENLGNKHGGFQAWKSLEIREIIGRYGKILEVTELLECHDNSLDIYFKCVLQFDFFTKKPGD